MVEKERKGVRILLKWLGLLFVGLGFLGTFLPLLPTTPFLLLAAYLFSKSSPKFHRWIFNNKIFGEYLRNYKNGGGIPLKIKVYVLVTMWGTIGFTALYCIDNFFVRITLAVIAIAVSVHIVMVKTRRVK